MTPVSTERQQIAEALFRRWIERSNARVQPDDNKWLTFGDLPPSYSDDFLRDADAVLLSLRASPTDGDDGVVDDLKSLAGRLTGNSQGILRDSIVISAAIDRISTQGKRLAELEGLVTDVRASALDDVSNITMRAEAAESALSTAEARGRQAIERMIAECDAAISGNPPRQDAGTWKDLNGLDFGTLKIRLQRSLLTNEAGK